MKPNAILLPIHPIHVAHILNGNKIYEFRKVQPKKYQPTKILIYSTAPVSKIVGEAQIEEILINSPAKIWAKTKNLSGISDTFFFAYFNNKTTAIAYKLKNIKLYSKPIELIEFGIKKSSSVISVLESKIKMMITLLIRLF